MAASKKQEELEQPAKVYQLLAVEVKVDQALTKLDQIVSSVEGVVTNIQLEARIRELKTEIATEIADEIEKVHLEYGPTKKGAWWLGGIVVTGIVGQIIIQITKPFGG